MIPSRTAQAGFFAAGLAGLAALHALGGSGLGAQLLVLVPAVALLGLPHGAFDLPMAQRVWQIDTPLGMAAFGAFYAGLAGLVLLLWIAAPGVALILFLAYSAHHFGGDWTDGGRGWRIAGGLSTLGAPALFHRAEVAALFGTLAPEPAASLAASGLVVAGAGAAALSLVCLAWTGLRRHPIEVGLLWLAAAVLPPLLYFVSYFCLLHSPRHVAEALETLGTSPAVLRPAAATVVATLVLAGLAALVLASSVSHEETALRVVFIGLAALTVPHMLLVDRWR